MKISAASWCLVLLAGFAAAQSPQTSSPEPASPGTAKTAEPTVASQKTSTDSSKAAETSNAAAESKTTVAIPAGTRIPLSLKQAISTKTAREGDPVYAETAFPYALNDRVVIPAGTYVQGKIMRAQRGGHIKGRAELLVHFTSMIYPNGYTVLLGGSVENTPGAEKSSMKDSEGTIQQDSDAGRKAKAAATGATTGALIGAVTDGGKGAGIGAGIGGLAGAGIAMLSRGADVRLEAGTSIEMEIQREITVDTARISGRREVYFRNE